MSNMKRLPDEYDDCLVLEPADYDEALIGVVYGGGVAIYDAQKVIEINMRQGMSEEEAIEHFEFNQEGSKGEGMPIFINRVKPK